MKKCVSLLLIISLITSMCVFFAGCSSKTKLFVYNVGDYIDPEVLKIFEKENPDINVKYEVYDSNEDMYTKVKGESSPYDVVFPSDYMIEQMIAEGMLNKLNYDNIPNYKNINESISNNLPFDKNKEYTVPYMWGTMGILYNTKMVKEEVNSWDILWDEEYKGNIYMLDQERDMVSIALKKCGYDMNSDNDAHLKEAEEALIKQKPLVKAYCGDEIKTNMIKNGAALAVVWSGDAYYCIKENPDLAYAVPEEGSNLWFDCMVVPKTSKHQEEAEKFIDFMSRPEIAKMNAEYIGYSTANAKALELFDNNVKNDKVRYPDLSKDFLAKMDVFSYNKKRNIKLTEIWDKVLG